MSIELPKDAEGREIPLDTEVLYRQDGEELKVIRWEFYPRGDTKHLVLLELNGLRDFYKPKQLLLTPPDSWKKLLEDLDRGADADFAFPCAYFDKGGSDCESCIVNMRTDWRTSCDRVAMSEIASRIRKLRGED